VLAEDLQAHPVDGAAVAIVEGGEGCFEPGTVEVSHKLLIG
jgi:hypothetical protein